MRIPRSRNALGTVVLKPPVLLATVIGFLLIGACSAVEVGVVATFEHGSLAAGLVLAVFSAGSLAGGLAFGHIPIGPWAMARRLLIVTVGLALTMVMLNVYWLGGTLILAGIGIAPALAVLFAITTASVKFSETAEAFGWAGTGQLIGAAAGSAVAGFLVDVGDWRGAYLAATIFAAVGLLVSIVFVRSFPDLRHRDASPHPDTEPLAVTPHEPLRPVLLPAIVCVGESMALITPTGADLTTADTASITHAGAEANVAVGVAAAGHRAVWASRLGDDPLGRRLSAELEQRRVELWTEVDPEAPTGVMFKDPGVESSAVYYYRRGSAASRMAPGFLSPRSSPASVSCTPRASPRRCLRPAWRWSTGSSRTRAPPEPSSPSM